MLEKQNLKRALNKIGIKHIRFLLLREDEAIIHVSELNTPSDYEIQNPQKVQRIATLLKFRKKDYEWIDQIVQRYKRNVAVVEVAKRMADWLEERNIKDGNKKNRYRRFLKNEDKWRKERITNNFEATVDNELLRKLNE